eukprot:GHVN01065987.1.p1 GENE.GHVN01065987.1~~GHVN01065987.1.p1  ORF type:complete len:137 (-),score=6.40 GHVN01065987.1:201-563(-)
MHVPGTTGKKAAFAPMAGSSFLASSHSDNSMILWDLSRIGAEHLLKTVHPNEPEFVFQHYGHRSPVADFEWNPNEGFEWFLLSSDVGNAGSDYHFMLWQVAERIRAQKTDPVNDGFTTES